MKKLEGTYVCDSMSNAGGYANYGKHFGKVAAFLARKDLSRLPTGRYEIDGEDAFATITEATLKAWEAARPEVHREYFDVHVPLSGEETIGVGTANPEERIDFDEDNDIGFCDGAAVEPLTVKPGEFLIVNPATCLHAPCCSMDGGGMTIRKIIIKVRA